MTKTLKNLFLLIALCGISFLFVSCVPQGPSIDLKVCTFESAEYVYDGTAKNLKVENMPTEAKVVYTNNNRINAGVYEVTAKITAGAKKLELKATLTINKAASVITADATQEYFLGTTALKAVGTINNDEQVISSLGNNLFNRPGTYTAVLSAAESKNYLSPSPVTVTVIVRTNPYDLSLPSNTFVADGTPKSLVIEGELPEGSHVEYIGNEQTVQGVYQVTANVLDANDEILCSVRGILTVDNPPVPEFKQFMDDFLVMIFEEDQMSINFFFNNPSNFGLEHYDAELPKYTASNFEEGQIEMQELINELHEFGDDPLSYEQQDSYEIVDGYLSYLYSITEPMEYMTNGYLGSYLGYQSNLPLNLAEYKFRNEQDVIDFLAYLADAPVAFKSYYDFSVKQADLGFGMPDYVITNVLDQCKEFVDLADDETHYLVEVFNSKIDEVTFIDETKKADYKTQANNLVRTELTEGYQYIIDNLPTLRGKATNEGGLANYTDGKEYYTIELREVTGYSDLTGEEAIEYINTKIDSYLASINRLVNNYYLSQSSYQGFVEAVNDGDPAFSELSFSDLVLFFEEYAKNYVPDLDVMPNISVKYVPESLQDFFSPAAYFVSPIDETLNESIYLNPKYVDDYNYVYTTLAHEGYPGHLYQNVYTKSLDIHNVRRVIRCDAYMEGWATYVEITAYNSVTNYTSTGQKLALQYFAENDVVNGLISARLDLGIHYEGWTVNDAFDWCKEYVNPDIAITTVIDIFNQLSEIPTNSIQYFYGYCKLQDMHDNTKRALRSLFNEVEFNKVVLDCGAAPLEMVEEAVAKYIAETKFIYGLN